jgi:hypothetical protein
MSGVVTHSLVDNRSEDPTTIRSMVNLFSLCSPEQVCVILSVRSQTEEVRLTGKVLA